MARTAWLAIAALLFVGAVALAADASRKDRPAAPAPTKSDASDSTKLSPGEPVPSELIESTSEKLWAEFVRAPYTHPQIPNVSFAGYHFSEAPLPSPAVVANVRTEGAQGDGETDDAPAFKAAIARAKQAGGGAVLIPAGHYRLDDMLVIDSSNLVLRGEGPTKTFLEFRYPASVVAPAKVGDWKGTEKGGRIAPTPIGSWYGGLIWVEPGGPTLAPVDVEINIQPLKDAVPVAAPAKQGDFALEVAPADAAKLHDLVGKMVPIAWTGDKSLALRIAGNPAMAQFDWSTWRELYDGQFTWVWANQIEKIEGSRVYFKKPLRMNADAGQLAIGATAPYVTEVGVESLAIKFPQTVYGGHHKEVGWNGVMFRRVAHSWIRDVAVENADNGALLAGECVNCTVRGFHLTGRQTHHGLANRFMSHDNLYEKFRLESPVIHGLNTEGESSGNVWHDGEMLNGTFDYHRMMSFDSVRTNITVNNNGGNGGNGTHGPAVGRRICHWNIRVTNGRGKWIGEPALFSDGAFVGIQGAPLELRATKLGRMPDGLDKGCVVADLGKVPNPPDLFEAQLKLRLGDKAAAYQK